MKTFVRIFLYIWQLPQNIIGFLLTRKVEMKSSRNLYFHITGKNQDVIYYFKKNFFNSGVSLGNYIILDYYYMGKEVANNAIRHEYGHQVQSKILGWLYLPLIGFPSIARNIWDRIAHKKWEKNRRYKWYYSGYHEKWADRLGDTFR